MIFFCLTPLSMLISRFIHVAANGIISCFFMTESYFSLYVCAPTTSFFPQFFFSPQFLCVYLVLAVLSVCCYLGFSLVVAGRGYTPAVVHGILIVVSSLVVEHML